MPQALRRPRPDPSAAAAQRRAGTSWPSLTAALATSALLLLCYFPVDYGWVAWFALVPWLMLVRADLPNRRRYFFAWLSGFVFYVPILAWMRTGFAEMAAFWILLSLYCSWYFPAALWLIRRLDLRTRLPLTVTIPLVWTGLEYVRGELMGGFAWYFLGHTQHTFLPAIQIADLAGVAAVSAVVAAVNGLLAEAVGRLPAARRWFGLSLRGGGLSVRAQTVAVAVLVGVLLGYGTWRLSDDHPATGPRIALLQPAIPQTERNAATVTDAGDPLARTSIQEQMATLTRTALRESARPDLIVWPETTVPAELWEAAPGGSLPAEAERWGQSTREYLREIATFCRTHVLFGLNTRLAGPDGKVRRYNTALLATPTGDLVGRYDKMHLVPFGEYIPLNDVFPFVERFSPYGSSDYTLTPGERQTRFTLPVGDRSYRLGMLICYEDADPPLARALVRRGEEPPVDFLVNISNDGWFMGSAEHAQHLAISRFRAVEARRSLIRAVNGGISAIIDGSGRIISLPTDDWSKSHSVTGVVSGVVPLDGRMSLYARLGDWLPWACWGVVLVGCCRRPKSDPVP